MLFTQRVVYSPLHYFTWLSRIENPCQHFSIVEALRERSTEQAAADMDRRYHHTRTRHCFCTKCTRFSEGETTDDNGVPAFWWAKYCFSLGRIHRFSVLRCRWIGSTKRALDSLSSPNRFAVTSRVAIGSKLERQVRQLHEFRPFSVCAAVCHLPLTLRCQELRVSSLSSIHVAVRQRHLLGTMYDRA